MKPKFPLFSEIVLLQDIPMSNLKRGSVATIVEHYSTDELAQDGYSLDGFDIAILNELWKKAILKNLLKAKDLKMSD